MPKLPIIPDHPLIANAQRTGYPHTCKSVRCVDCEQDFYGDEKMYICDGDIVCGDCMKDRLLDAYGVEDLARAFDISGTTVSDYLNSQED